MNTNDRTHTSETRAEQVASQKLQSITLGLDVHADSIMVVRLLEHGGPQPAQKFEPAKFLEWVARQQRLAVRVNSCYEAGPFGYGLHRALEAMGVSNVVVQPVDLDAAHKGVKNDKSDARELCLRLDRYVRGNAKALATVRVPTPEQEQKRVESRQREQLRRQLMRLAAQGRSLLLSQGHRQRQSWWEERWWKQLKGQLPAWLVERLEVFRRLLLALRNELELATRALEAAAAAQRPKGMGGLTYEVIEREVGDWDRFSNRREVASYTGLCGGLSASGSSVRLLSITKHGHRRLRTALIELAWRLIQFQPQCALVRRWWQQLMSHPRRTAAVRKKAIVAMARQLAVDLWRWRTGRVQPPELGWVMSRS